MDGAFWVVLESSRQKMCLMSAMSQFNIVKHIFKSVFRHHNVGLPPIFVWGGYRPPSPPKFRRLLKITQ